jgi:hypothetical protein
MLLKPGHFRFWPDIGAVEGTSVYQRNTPVTRNSAHTVEFVRDVG